MPNEHSGISRRRLLCTASIGVPAAGVLALGSSIVSVPAAQSLEADGYWGSETTSQLQKFFFNIFAQELGQPTYGYEDGVVKYQPVSQQSANPGLGSGWQWESDGGAQGYDFTIYYLQRWLGGVEADGTIGPNTIKALQNHYGLTADGRLDGPSETITALQNEISQYVG